MNFLSVVNSIAHYYYVRQLQDKITQTARNAEYNPKRFQAVIMRIREPRTTALIFASGKVRHTSITFTILTAPPVSSHARCIFAIYYRR